MDVGDWKYVLLEVDNIIVLAALALLVLVVLLFPVSKHVRDATGAIGFTAVVTGAVVAIVMVAAAAPQWPVTSCSAETRGDSGHDVIESGFGDGHRRLGGRRTRRGPNPADSRGGEAVNGSPAFRPWQRSRDGCRRRRPRRLPARRHDL